MTIEAHCWLGIVTEDPVSIDSLKQLDKYFTRYIDLNALTESFKTIS